MVIAVGEKNAEKLKQRMMELSAAKTLSEISHLPPARCHEYFGKEAGIFSVDLVHPFRLLFIPAENPIPRCKDGGIDREKITDIEIIKIKDPH